MKKLIEEFIIPFSWITGFFALLNLIFGFANVNFDFAAGFSDPYLMLKYVWQPAWVKFWMPGFFITDHWSWYVAVPLLSIITIHIFNLKNKWLLTGLAIAYSAMGNYTATQFSNAYDLYLTNPIQYGDMLVKASLYAYRVGWGTFNNSWGGILFLSMGWQLKKVSPWGYAGIVTGTAMIITAMSYVTGLVGIADWSVIFYFIAFCINAVGLGYLIRDNMQGKLFLS